MNRRELQARCKTVGIKANQSNVAMRDALAALDTSRPLQKASKSRKLAALGPSKSRERRAPGDTAPTILSHIDAGVLKQWRVVRPLGLEGKDGQVFLVESAANASVRGALKVFKPKKSVKRIATEVQLQSSAAQRGLAPSVLSTWRIDEGHRCFVMEALDRTLGDIAVAQRGVLTPAQTTRVAELYGALSASCATLHNDENVAMNIMERVADGELFLIDFGFARPITPADVRKRGIDPNMALLAAVDRVLRKAGGSAVFAGRVAAYEAKHGVCVDARGAMKRKLQERTRKLVAKHRAR